MGGSSLFEEFKVIVFCVSWLLSYIVPYNVASAQGGLWAFVYT